MAASAVVSGGVYARRKPEDTLLYQAVETHFDDFVALRSRAQRARAAEVRCARV